MASPEPERKARQEIGVVVRCWKALVAGLLQALALVLAQPALAQPTFAQPTLAQPAAPTHIKAELIADGPAMPGGTLMLAIRMQPDAGWHGYWLNPGDAGLGMELKWSLPGGTKAGAPRYPVPRTLIVSGLMNHVYDSEYAVLVPLALAPDAKPGSSLAIALDARWLACTDEICVPEQARLHTTVTIGPRRIADARFDGWQARLPAPLNAPAHFAITPATIRIGIPLPATVALEDPHLFAATDKVVDYPAVQGFARQGDLLVVTLQRPKMAAAAPAAIPAVLRLNRAGDGLALLASPGPVPIGGDPVTIAAPGASGLPALPLLVLAALAGGILLNIMPCVFPILSLKALSLARAGESAAQARSEGLAYTGGVITACLGLGVLLLALRAAGNEVGWAFQLQEPAVVTALLLLAVAITANLLGLFELAVPGFVNEGSPRDDNWRGAFATGLLAAFVATPCTGPFMAAAMGAALLLPWASALLLFAALGLGIALPFLAIALVPALRRRLPRPGAWMVRFRRWMALPMGLTALALAWLASRLGGTTFAGLALASAFALVGLLALIGKRQRSGLSAMTPSWSAVALGIIAVSALPRFVGEVAVAEQGLLAARPFSEAALARARASGKPVFAWFTADWCLTCKVNERVAIEREETRAAFEKAGVVVLRGDWTRRDPAITRYLTAQGAAGVPLYVWYPASGGAPRQLPQVLTTGDLTGLAGKR